MDDLQELYDDVWSFVDRHPVLEALLILISFYVLARVVDWLVSGFLTRLTRRSRTRFDDRLIRLLHRPVKVTIVLIGVIVAAYRLELDRDWERPIVLVTVTIVIVLWMVYARRISKLVLATMGAREDRFQYVQPATEPLLSNAIAVVYFLVAAYAILLIWDINVTGLVASAGILGLALSFAAQDTLGNLFAGIAILSDRPYQIGDFIILDSGERGEVVRIGLRSTSLLTRDDVEVSIPNGIMGSSKIVNEAGGPPQQFRIRTAVSVAYDSDLDQVVDIMMGIAEEHPDTLDDPPPRVRFRSFGDSGLLYELLCWIHEPAERGRVVHELNTEIHSSFAAAGVKIPFPQREVHMHQVTGRDLFRAPSPEPSDDT